MARLKVGNRRNARHTIPKAGIVAGDTLTITKIHGGDSDPNPTYDVTVRGQGGGIQGDGRSAITHQELTGNRNGRAWDH